MERCPKSSLICRQTTRHTFSNVLSLVASYTNWTRALTFSECVCCRSIRRHTSSSSSAHFSRWKAWSDKSTPHLTSMRLRCRGPSRHTFSKVLSIVASYTNCTRALTFQNVSSGRSRPPRPAAPALCGTPSSLRITNCGGNGWSSSFKRLSTASRGRQVRAPRRLAQRIPQVCQQINWPLLPHE